MLKPLLLASAFALAAPAMAQDHDMNHDMTEEEMAPPITDGVAAPNVQDDTAPNLAPGQIPTGDASDEAEVDVEAAASLDAGASASTDTMTVATDAGTTTAADAVARTRLYTGMGGPVNIDDEWAIYAGNGTTLSPLAFSNWLHASQGQRGAASTAALNMTALAFARADTNNDWMVSRDELAAFMPE